jgi:ISXO2-like transposase domain
VDNGLSFARTKCPALEKPQGLGIVGSYHKVSEKHLDTYLDEFEWRFNNRRNPYLFRDTILKLIASPKLEYKKLTENVA